MFSITKSSASVLAVTPDTFATVTPTTPEVANEVRVPTEVILVCAAVCKVPAN